MRKNSYSPNAQTRASYLDFINENPNHAYELDDIGNQQQCMIYARSHNLTLRTWYDYIVIRRTTRHQTKEQEQPKDKVKEVVVLVNSPEENIVIDDKKNVDRHLSGVRFKENSIEKGVKEVNVEMVTKCFENSDNTIICPSTKVRVLSNEVVDTKSADQVIKQCVSSNIDSVEALKDKISEQDDKGLSIAQLAVALSPQVQPVKTYEYDNYNYVVPSQFSFKNFGDDYDSLKLKFANISISKSSFLAKMSDDHVYTLGIDTQKLLQMFPLIDFYINPLAKYINVHSRNKNIADLFINRYPNCVVRMIGNNAEKGYISMSEEDLFNSVSDYDDRRDTVAIFPDISRVDCVTSTDMMIGYYRSKDLSERIRRHYKYFYRYVYLYAVDFKSTSYKLTGAGFKGIVIETSLGNVLNGKEVLDMLFNQMWHYYYFNWIRKPLYSYIPQYLSNPHGSYDFSHHNKKSVEGHEKVDVHDIFLRWNIDK